MMPDSRPPLKATREVSGVVLGFVPRVRPFVAPHAQEVITAAVAKKKNSHEEDQKMAIVTSFAPTSTAPAVHLCTSCKKKPLSFNNTTGVCTNCQALAGGRVRVRSKKVNGHTAVRPFARGLQLARRAEVAEPAAAPEPAKSNGGDRNHVSRGTGAQPAKEHSRSLGVTRIEERVQLLLAAVPLDAVIAAIPREDQAKLISAWLAGAL